MKQSKRRDLTEKVERDLSDYGQELRERAERIDAGVKKLRKKRRK